MLQTAVSQAAPTTVAQAQLAAAVAQTTKPPIQASHLAVSRNA